MRARKEIPKPSALAVGMLLDGNRALFLIRKTELGETYELPCALVYAGEDPVGAIVSQFAAAAGIDAQAHEVIMERRHNVGSRKRRVFVPVLVFRMSAKAAQVKPGGGFSGYKWLEQREMKGKRLSKNCEWLY